MWFYSAKWLVTEVDSSSVLFLRQNMDEFVVKRAGVSNCVYITYLLNYLPTYLLTYLRT